MTSGALVLAALDAIGRVIWHSMLQVLPAEGCADGCCRRSVAGAGETVGNEFPDAADFTQTARYYVLRHIAAKLPHSIELPPELRAFKELTDRLLVQ